MTMRKWTVITPSFDYIERVDEHGGPTYSARDVVTIQARTRRDAVTMGVKYMLSKPEYMRGEGFTYVHDQRSDRMCPFTGVRAYTYKELARLDGYA